MSGIATAMKSHESILRPRGWEGGEGPGERNFPKLMLPRLAWDGLWQLWGPAGFGQVAMSHNAVAKSRDVGYGWESLAATAWLSVA